MVTINVKKHTVAAFALALLAGSAANVHAVMLAPGDSSGLLGTVGSTTFIPVGPTDGATLVASQTTLFNGVDAFSNILFTANVNQAVIREASGTLSFYYQVVSLTGNPLGRFTINGFGAYTTDVFVNSFDILGGDLVFNLGDNTPDFKNPPAILTDAQLYFNQDRDFSGNTIGFTFNKTGILNNQLNPVESTYWLGIKTNATDYTLSSGQLIDGAVSTKPIYAPAVPEPTTWLFGALLTGAMGVRLPRRGSRT